MPFLKLKKAGRHKFGSLRMWVKSKFLNEIWEDERVKSEERRVNDDDFGTADPWKKAKWRPLVSFAGHHWKSLFVLRVDVPSWR